MQIKHKPKVIRGSIASTTARSIARLYPQGINLLTRGRSGLTSVSIQNLETSKEVRFWHGLVPLDAFAADPVYLAEDPTTWDAAETTAAIALIGTYGEKVEAGQYLEPFIPPTQQVYSYVASGTVKAHVKEG